jgi:ketopantoate reductase
MDRVATYREIIKRTIADYAALKPSYGDVEVETICDESHDHYEMVYTGWDGWRRIHGVVIHVDIRDGKVWIQHDGTEDGIAEEFVQAGIPREHIVLAFHHPVKRKYTQFAVS